MARPSSPRPARGLAIDCLMSGATHEESMANAMLMGETPEMFDILYALIYRSAPEQTPDILQSTIDRANVLMDRLGSARVKNDIEFNAWSRTCQAARPKHGQITRETFWYPIGVAATDCRHWRLLTAQWAWASDRVPEGLARDLAVLGAQLASSASMR